MSKWFKANLYIPANDDDDVLFGVIEIKAANQDSAQGMLEALLGHQLNLCYDDLGPCTKEDE